MCFPLAFFPVKVTIKAEKEYTMSMPGNPPQKSISADFSGDTADVWYSDHPAGSHIRPAPVHIMRGGQHYEYCYGKSAYQTEHPRL